MRRTLVNVTLVRFGSVASVLPYWVLTALFVSVGPLLYIVITGLRDE